MKPENMVVKPLTWHALIGILGIITACSPAWVAKDDSCVRENEERPTERVINKADPELCDRYVKSRPSQRVRIGESDSP